MIRVRKGFVGLRRYRFGMDTVGKARMVAKGVGAILAFTFTLAVISWDIMGGFGWAPVK